MFKVNVLPRNVINFLVATLLFLSGTVSANMTVYPMELNVDSSGAAQIKIASKSDDIQFVRVTTKKVINPGTPEEKEIDIESWKGEGLVATPAKFALAAGTLRVVRLVVLNAPEKESTWRVYFEGVKQLDNLLHEDNGKKNTAASAQLGVNIVWGALVHVAPKNPQIAVRIDTQKGQLINNGTQRIPLKEIGVCLTQDECQWTKELATLYPDTQRTLKSLKIKTGAKYKVRYFNWLNKTTEETDVPAV